MLLSYLCIVFAFIFYCSINAFKRSIPSPDNTTLILAIEANESMQKIYGHMSVVLNKEEIGEWVSRRKSVNEVLYRVPMRLEKRLVG